MARERLLVRTFVELTEGLAGGGDVYEFLRLLVDRCDELVQAAAAGVLLADQEGTLRLAAASTSDARALELFQGQAEEGPCYDAYRDAEQVIEPDLGGERARRRWPDFTQRARELEFGSVHAFPLRFGGHRIGALNVFFVETGVFEDDEVYLLQALADVATVELIEHAQLRRSNQLSEQLQHALDSRVLIEQAKGVLCAELEVGMTDAFELLRSCSKSSNRRIREVAEHVTDHRRLPDPVEFRGRKP